MNRIKPQAAMGDLFQCIILNARRPEKRRQIKLNDWLLPTRGRSERR